MNDTAKIPSPKTGVAFLIMGAAILLMTLHPNVWGFWSMFIQPGLWIWPGVLYGFTFSAMGWGVVQIVKARRAARG